MGRVRTKSIKNISADLAEKYPEELGKDFEKNKEFLRKLIDAKKTRNKIAGYIVTLKKK